MLNHSLSWLGNVADGGREAKLGCLKNDELSVLTHAFAEGFMWIQPILIWSPGGESAGSLRSSPCLPVVYDTTTPEVCLASSRSAESGIRRASCCPCCLRPQSVAFRILIWGLNPTSVAAAPPVRGNLQADDLMMQPVEPHYRGSHVLPVGCRCFEDSWGVGGAELFLLDTFSLTSHRRDWSSTNHQCGCSRRAQEGG